MRSIEFWFVLVSYDKFERVLLTFSGVSNEFQSALVSFIEFLLDLESATSQFERVLMTSLEF